MSRTERIDTEHAHDIAFVDAEGRQRTLGEFRGEVLLIVNTASY